MGVRQRHRLPGLGRARLAHVAHDPDLRPRHPVEDRFSFATSGCPGSSRAHRAGTDRILHGPISTGPKGNRVYFAYGTSSYGILQIVDREKLLRGPKEPTPENLLYPQIGRLDLRPDAGAHTAFPVLGVERRVHG